MNLSLVMFKSDGTRRDFPITKDRVVIGRKPNCDLRIPLTSVSRQHCELRVDDGTAYVKDLGSSNGTYHNSVRVQEQALSAGDEVVIGPVVFTVVIDGEPAQIEPVRTVINRNDSSGSGPAEATQAPSAKGQEQSPEPEPSAELEQIEPAAEGAPEPAPASGADDLLEVADAGSADDDAQPAPKDDQAQADPEGPQELPTGDDQMPEQVEEETHSPTVDLDDPIAALERLADAEDDDSSNQQSSSEQSNEDDDELQILWDDDDDDKGKGKGGQQ